MLIDFPYTYALHVIQFSIYLHFMMILNSDLLLVVFCCCCFCCCLFASLLVFLSCIQSRKALSISRLFFFSIEDDRTLKFFQSKLRYGIQFAFLLLFSLFLCFSFTLFLCNNDAYWLATRNRLHQFSNKIFELSCLAFACFFFSFLLLSLFIKVNQNRPSLCI